jgi:hypothetical protein
MRSYLQYAAKMSRRSFVWKLVEYFPLRNKRHSIYSVAHALKAAAVISFAIAKPRDAARPAKSSEVN